MRTDPETHKKDIISLGKMYVLPLYREVELTFRSTSLEINHKHMEVIKKSQAGGGVAVKIEHAVRNPCATSDGADARLAELRVGQAVRTTLYVSLSSRTSSADAHSPVDDTDEVIAMVSRVSIDTLKTHFRDDVSVVHPLASLC